MYYACDVANELAQFHDKDGWTYFAYDANGNTVQEQTPAWTRYYDWDGRDMLVGVRSTEGAWTDNAYRYDGMSSRVCTVEAGGLTYYDWDGIRVLQEKDGAGSVTDRQIHPSTALGAGGYAPIPSVGDTAHVDKAGTIYVPTADQVGTIHDLIDMSASKANSYTYDAFGVARSASEAVTNLYRFGGKRLDADSTHYHFIARQYAPAVGQFASRDPWPMGQRFARSYTYAEQLPIARVDPMGFWTEIERNYGSRARTCAEKDYDSVMALARMARLEHAEAYTRGTQEGWLLTEDGRGVRTIRDIKAGEWYTVPNTVYFDVMLFSELSSGHRVWEFLEHWSLVADGFDIEKSYDTTFAELLQQVADRDIFGLEWFSHYVDPPKGVLHTAPTPTSPAGSVVGAATLAHHRRHKYRLGCLKIVMCHGAHEPWRQNVARWGYYWARRGTVWGLGLIGLPHSALGGCLKNYGGR